MNISQFNQHSTTSQVTPHHSTDDRLLRNTRRVISIFGLAVVFVALFAVSSVNAAPAAPEDTPTPIVVDTVDDWSIGSGLLYWGMDCLAVEFGGSGFLKRQPLAGGTQRTLELTNDANCQMPYGMNAQDDGVYYTDLALDANRIERTPSSEPYTGLPVATPAQADLPGYFAQLEATATHIYWPAYFGGKILRAPRAVGAVETVADGLTNPLDLVVVGSTVYWTQSNGVWLISTNCATLPCTDTKRQFAPFPANTTGNSLLFRRTRFDRYTVYWVQRTVSSNVATSAIRYFSCNDNAICPFPGESPATLYTAVSGWEIGGLTSDGTSLFWSEVYNNGATHDGNVKRRALSGGDPANIAVNQTYIDTRKLFIANGNLYFARLAGAGVQSGIYALPLSASAITRDLAASAFEVTQAIQNLANEAPLAAQKTTYVRTYGSLLSGPNAPTVEAWLVGKRGGVDLPGSPLRPLNGVRALAVGATYDRARLNDGWLFLLPASWTEGAVALELRVDPQRNQSDNNLENNTLARSVTFQNQPPVCVWTVPVRTHTPLPSTNDPNFWTMVDHFKRRWPAPDVWVYRDTSPVEELQVCWWGPVPYPCFGPYELEEGWAIDNGIPDRDKVIASLWTRAQLSFNPDACDDIGAPVHFMGLVHPNANNGGAAGYASTISNQSWVQLPPRTPNPLPQSWDALREGSVMAQELAHNYGRQHVNCGNNPDDIDTNYPYPPCQIANTGADSYYGFDVTTRQPIRPNQTADFMSYADRSWVSDYTWRALIGAFASRIGSAQPAGGAQTDANSVFVTGLVDLAAERGAIATVLVLPDASLPPATRQGQPAQRSAPNHAADPQAAYSLRLLDANGTVLHSEPLTPLPMDDHVGDADSALFSAVFAPPAGQVATIQLLADATVLDTLTPGVNPPSVAIQQPAAGAQIDNALVIAWSASDPDPADQLLFTLQYSHDNGASWHTLITDYPGNPTGSYTLNYADLGSLPGSAANAARVRVLASDGYNTGSALSPAFTVSNRAPAPYVVAPGAGQALPAGATVVLAGGATDAEDGGLADAALTWAVDGVAAGSGAQVSAAGLAPGAHTAVLTATDVTGNAATAGVGFSVAPLALPLGAAPVLDGACEDNSYGASAQVQLAPYAGGAQATVRLLRSADALWACFSGMPQGAATPGAFAGLRVDVDNSRDAVAQASDFGFFAGEDGDVFTLAGDGAGGFAATGPGGLQAQISAQTNTWSAELRIPAATLGGWDHLVGLSFGHYWRDFQGDDYLWPYRAVWNAPGTWALTALGDQPVISAIAPVAVAVGAPDFVLNIEGSGFAAGATVLWGGVPLSTTLVDSEHLTAVVAAGQVGGARLVQVTAVSSAPGSFTSNALPFLVEATAPVISSLAPTGTVAGGPSFMLTVNGSNFAPDAQILWNGAPLATNFINAGQLTVQVGAALIAQGQTAGIAVRNPLPSERISTAVPFAVAASGAGGAASEHVYLPFTQR